MKNGLYFRCTVAGLPAETFQVASFNLTEGLSELFTLQMTLASERDNLDPEEFLLKAASLTIQRNGQQERTIKGLVESMAYTGHNKQQTLYTLTVRPEMWLLTLDQDSRIYHHLSAPEILRQILHDKQIRSDSRFLQPHPTREYITMKRESSYQFFQRLLAEIGSTFWFDDNSRLYFGDTRLNLVNNAQLIYNPQEELSQDGNTVYRISLGTTMRPGATMHKDRNYLMPRHPLLQQELPEQGADKRFTIYESYGRFQQAEEGRQLTKYRMDALHADRKWGQAQSDCIRLRPGRIFFLNDHPLERLNNQWQVITVTHQGHQPEVLDGGNNGQGTILTNNATFIPGQEEWRPPFHYKPLADGDEVATVVGPPGEEIYVNEDGAIRVHFHWNRYDKDDDRASCWVRVAQGWNGDNFGFLATPRIGQEVIVSYLNGDIDRPIVTGCNYNAVNRPPLDLPAEKTRTTFKTKTHKGEGFNELRFEDERNQEEIFIHAQKDMNTKVLHDRTTTVLNDHTETIKGHQTIEITKNQTQTVHGNQTETIDGNQTLTVKQNQTETVLLAKAETVGLAKALSIGTTYQTTVGMMMNSSVGMIQSTQVGMTKSLVVGKSYSCNVGETVTYSIGKQKTETVGKVALSSVGEYLELVCGSARIVLTKEGGVFLQGKHIELLAEDVINGDGKEVNWNVGEAVIPPDAPSEDNK